MTSGDSSGVVRLIAITAVAAMIAGGCTERATARFADEQRYDQSIDKIVKAAGFESMDSQTPNFRAGMAGSRKRLLVPAGQLASKERSCAQRIKLLKPPAEYASVHAAYINLYQGSANLDQAWAEAIRRGGRKADQEAYSKLVAFQPAAYEDLVAAYRRAGRKSPTLDAQLAAVQRQFNK